MSVGIRNIYPQRSTIVLPINDTTPRDTDISFKVTAGQRVYFYGGGYYAGSTGNVLNLILSGSVTFSEFNFTVQSSVTLVTAPQDVITVTALNTAISCRISNFPGNLRFNGFIYATSTGIITLRVARAAVSAGTCTFNAGNFFEVVYL